MDLLAIGYLSLTLFTLVFLLKIGKLAIVNSSSNHTNKFAFLLIGLISWQVFIYLVSKSGFTANLDFPPRFALMFILPSFIFTGVFLLKNRNSKWIMEIPASWIVYFQSFRILVESLFILSVTKGILHEEVTLNGYNYDMIFAMTAPIVAYLVFSKKLFSLKTLMFWNYAGLAVIASIIFLFLSTIYKPEWYGSDTAMLPMEALKYPYVLIAGFLMPVAVFLHVLSILQIRRFLNR